MNVIKASAMGSCFGVERALKLFFEQTEAPASSPLYTYGHLIHNKEVLRSLGKTCVKVIKDATSDPPGRVVIRAHGIDKNGYEAFIERGFEVIDATCPFVKKNILSIIAENNPILYIGQAEHSETLSYRGSASVSFFVLTKPDDAETVEKGRRYSLYMQTTVESELASSVLRALDEKGFDYEIKSRICHASRDRRAAIDELAAKVKVIVVVGDRTSANSMALIKRVEDNGAVAYLVETASDVALLPIKGEKEVGLSAAASVTAALIEKVYQRLLEL
jgi:Penicillin tolerance protein